ncbi:MAG TPA: rhamnogalacturonan acetylesterase [Opitutus sp.]|nr:rhamnogalacturonan acetylesterase [Opitutus sp.]
MSRLLRLPPAVLAFASAAFAGPVSWRFAIAPAAEPGATAVTADAAFSPARGYGFDLGTALDPATNKPFFFSVAVPEGNYRVTVTLGDSHAASDTTVKAESRRLMLEHVVTAPGEIATRSFVVNVRDPHLPPPPLNAPGGSAVLLNEREQGSFTWDDKLTLEFDGPAPRVRTIAIEPARVPTIFLAGDSTVTDQRFEPAASWGQMLPRFFKPDAAVANHAESGETLKSFLSELRLAKILSQIKPGDWLFIQFAHNDEKKNWPQTYVEAHTTYAACLRVYLAEARLRGATPVLVTPMQRRTFDAHGKIKNTHGDYPAVVREIAREQNVALVDLDRLSTAFYEALGPARAPRAFNAGGKDATHHDNYGAYELARCVVQAIRDAHLPLARHLADDISPFDPAHPDPVDGFDVPPSPLHSEMRPRGN